MAQDGPVDELLAALAWPATRAAAAAALAAHAGAEAAILLGRDSEIGALLPARGLAQTLPGGAGWRALIAACAAPGQHAGNVEFPLRNRVRRAVASSSGAAALVLIGEFARIPPGLEPSLTILGALLGEEWRSEAALGKEAAAQQSLQQAAIARATLDGTRAQLERTIGETRRLFAELKLKERQKDEFLAMLAHELRNPLAPIAASVELLRKGTDARRVADILERQTRHLTRLVDDLIDISRISRGRIELDRSTVQVAAVLDQALEASAPALEQAGHRLVFECPRDLYVDGDGVRLTQLFENLLNNAVKYTPPGGRITVAAQLLSGAVEVRVRDSGIGVEPEMLDQIFDLFVQVPRSLDRSQGGLGIGLTLVRRIAELHGGGVRAESEGLGRGAEFIVRLPAVGAPVAPEAKSQERFASSLTGLRILIIEDNADAAELLGMALGQEGAMVDQALDGPAGLRAAQAKVPDIVLVDIGLPGLDGFAVAQALRSLVPGALLIAVSGYTAEVVKSGDGKVFDGWLVKPIEFDELLGAIGAARRVAAGRTA